MQPSKIGVQSAESGIRSAAWLYSCVRIPIAYPYCSLIRGPPEVTIIQAPISEGSCEKKIP